MTLGELDYKFRLLQNFKLNLLRIGDDKSTRRQIMKQAIQIVSQIDEAIKSNKVKAEDCVGLVKEYELGSILKAVRRQK